MKKQCTEMFTKEQVVFDDYGFTKNEYEKSQRKMKRLTIAAGMAAVSTLITVVMLFVTGDAPAWVWCADMILAVASYIVGGALWSIIKMMVGVSAAVWNLCPIIILDIGFAAMAFFIMGIVFFILPFPIIPVAINYFSVRSLYKEAEEALSYFVPADNA